MRLENRCANIEKMSKNLKGGPTSLPSKTGQSPFIPGPSRQILEGLMKENSELKKTLNSLTRKGASGYLEAVVSGWRELTITRVVLTLVSDGGRY